MGLGSCFYDFTTLDLFIALPSDAPFFQVTVASVSGGARAEGFRTTQGALFLWLQNLAAPRCVSAQQRGMLSSGPPVPAVSPECWFGECELMSL